MALDQKQAWVMLTGIIAGVLTLLFPVCNNSSKMVDEADFFAVHSYLFAWPLQSVDYERTLLQLGLVGLLTWGALISVKMLCSSQPAQGQADTIPISEVA